MTTMIPTVFLKRLLKYTLLLPGTVTRTEQEKGCIILAYHRIGSGIRGEMELDVETFRWQIQFLKNYPIVSLDQALEHLRTGSLREDIVVLTFDDGYSDFYLNVFPILRSYQIPAVLYIATHYIETGENFPFDANLSAERRALIKPLEWGQIEEMSATGLVTVGCHTHTHSRLDSIPEHQIAQELSICKDLIEERLNQTACHFCYPEGLYTACAERLVGRLFSSAVVPGNKKNTRYEPLLLVRNAVVRSDTKTLFKAHLRGQTWLYGSVMDSMHSLYSFWRRSLHY